MRLAFAVLSFMSVALAAAAAAQAQSERTPSPGESPATPLSVSREAGAETCPDAPALTLHVVRLRGQQAAGAQAAYHVTFSRDGGVLRAAIRPSGGGGVRVLKDRGQDCASLEQATALTLALLLDSDARQLTSARPEPEPPPRARAPGKPPERAPRAATRDTVRLALSFGGAGLFGVVQGAAPAAVADWGVFVNRFHTSLGVLGVPAQKLDLGPGQLRETLLSGVARTCYAAATGDRVRVELCTGIYAGLWRVQARGYTRNDSLERAWLAVPLELSISTRSSPLGVELGVSALLPLRQSDFAIDNLGTAYESWPVGGLLSLRALGSWLF